MSARFIELTRAGSGEEWTINVDHILYSRPIVSATDRTTDARTYIALTNGDHVEVQDTPSRVARLLDGELASRQDEVDRLRTELEEFKHPKSSLVAWWRGLEFFVFDDCVRWRKPGLGFADVNFLDIPDAVVLRSLGSGLLILCRDGARHMLSGEDPHNPECWELELLASGVES